MSFRDVLFPVFGIVMGGIGCVGFQHPGLGPFGAQEREGKFVGRDHREMAALELAEDRLASTLLPDGAGLVVAQQGVAVVDAGKGEVDCAKLAIDEEAAVVDHAGVAKGAVGGGDGDAGKGVVDDVVVAHGADGEGVGLAVDGDAKELVILVDRDFSSGTEGWRRVGMEHPLEDIDACERSGGDSYDCAEDKQNMRQDAGRAPGPNQNCEHHQSAQDGECGAEIPDVQRQSELVRPLRAKGPDHVERDRQSKGRNRGGQRSAQYQ